MPTAVPIGAASNMRSLDDPRVAELRSRLGGSVLTPRDAGYDASRWLWNGRIDRYPAAIARCTSTADVVTCVRFAREHDLELAVRGSGHAVAGIGLCNGGLVADLAGVKGIEIDPRLRRAWVQPGETWGSVDRATQAFGLAVPGGTDSEVGVSGLTLGGGNGWLMGAFGATVDNLLSVELVLANGNVVRASVQEHPDLFWATRGGGGNFGVATKFEFALHAVGPEVFAGAVYYSFEDTKEVLQAFRDVAETLPDPLTVYPCLIFDEGSRPVLCLAACYAGPVQDGERAAAPLRHVGRFIRDDLAPRPFVAWQSIMDAARPAGRGCAIRSHFLARIDDGFIDVVTHQFARAPSPLSVVVLEHCHGAIARVPTQATAFALRTNPYHFEILAFWDDLAKTADNLRWADDFMAATRPFSSGEVYVNSLDEAESGRVPEAYGVNFERLRLLKKKYDPQNFFHCNHNIPPA